MFGMQGYGRGFGKGMRYGFPTYGNFPSTPVDELEALRLYKDRLQLRQKELEAELKAVEKRIASLEK